MTKATSYTILFCNWLIGLTIVYFLALWLALPLWLTVSLVVALGGGIFYLLPRKMDCMEPTVSPSAKWGCVLILVAGMLYIIDEAYEVETKYGHWDAWWFWNVRAHFLAKQEYWKLAFSGEQYGTVFTVPVAHSDYPPFLPLLVGFCWRTMGMQPGIIPYAISIFSFILMPSIIFIELYGRNKVIAIAALFLFIMQDNLIALGVCQIADNWIALFLLLSFICWYGYRQSGNDKNLVWLGAMLGGCLWVKNEGILLSLIFMAFVARELGWAGLKKLFYGMAIPLAMVVAFKLLIAPSNDMIAGHKHFPWGNLLKPERYKLIWDTTRNLIELYYPALPYLLIGYIAFMFIDKKGIDKPMLIILLVFICYLAVYQFSPHDLEWHVRTSVDRLIFQLFPSLIWIIAFRLSKVRFSIS